MQCILAYLSDTSEKPYVPPRCRHLQLFTLASNVFVPPIVTIPEDLIFPLCITRMPDDNDLACSDYMKGRECATRTDLPMKCREVVSVGSYTARLKASNGTIIRYEFNVDIDLYFGTRSVADIFWYCGEGSQIQDTLERCWEGVCVPVILSSTLSILARDDEPRRAKRDIVDLFYERDQNVVFGPLGPRNIPSEFLAMSEMSLSYNPIFFPESNGRWINYLYYNQQRFINFTIKALDLVREQLHATPTMTLQNRFILDTILAEEQGVCMRIGPECCSVIPMHSGPSGNLTKVIRMLEVMRDEHVRHITSQADPWWNWLKLDTWKVWGMKIGLVLSAVLVMFMVLSCCVIPLLRAMVQRMVGGLTKQFVVITPDVGFSRGVDVKQSLGPMSITGDDPEDDLFGVGINIVSV